MKTFTAYLPYSEVEGKSDTGRDIQAKNKKAAMALAIPIYGPTVKVIEPYNPHYYDNKK